VIVSDSTFPLTLSFALCRAKESIKLETTKERIKEKLARVRQFVRSMCSDVLFPLLAVDADIAAACGVPGVAVFVSTSGEADVEIARLACRKRAAAVLSNESDFFVFDSPAACVSFASLSVSDEGVKGLGVKPAALAAWLKLPVCALSTFACLVGNDTCTAPTWARTAMAHTLAVATRRTVTVPG
jgi:hypothetical protein